MPQPPYLPILQMFKRSLPGETKNELIKKHYLHANPNHIHAIIYKIDNQ